MLTLLYEDLLSDFKSVLAAMVDVYIYKHLISNTTNRRPRATEYQQSQVRCNSVERHRAVSARDRAKLWPPPVILDEFIRRPVGLCLCEAMLSWVPTLPASQLTRNCCRGPLFDAASRHLYAQRRQRNANHCFHRLRVNTRTCQAHCSKA